VNSPFATPGLHRGSIRGAASVQLLAIGAAKVTIDQRMGELPLPARELEPVGLQFAAARVRSCNACRFATSMRSASCRHSTLAIDDRPLVSAYAVRVLAPGRVGVGVVEGVDRIARCDLNVKARAGCQVSDGKFHSVELGVPKEENFHRPAQSLGQFSSRRTHAFARCGRRAVAASTALGGLMALSAIGLDLLACRGEHVPAGAECL